MPFGFLTKIFGLKKIPVFDQIGEIVDGLHTSQEEKDEYKLAAETLRQSGALEQIKTNRQEVQHRSVFVAGWRPAVGWVCAIALGWHYVVYNLLGWAFAVLAPETIPPPQIDIEDLLGILGGMLGLAVVRSRDKEKQSTEN